MQRRDLLGLLLAAACTPQVLAQAGGQTGGQTGGQAEAIETLARALEKNYVLPDVGARYAMMLRANLAAGLYAPITESGALATRLTADLQAINRDGHLKVREDASFGEPLPRGPRGTGSRPPGVMGASPPPAITETKWLRPGVAFIGFNMFPGTDESVAAVAKFMSDYAGAKALVIDARTHRGGGLAEMDEMLPLLFARRTVLVAMDLRRTVYEERGAPMEAPSLVEVPSPPGLYRQVHVVTPRNDERRWRAAKVFYLTSNRTASAAEHLALAFKRSRRATLIGATTAGANHFGGPEPIGAGLTVFLPVGRTSDPDTNWDWEGVGVAPDVACDPAVAIEEALKRV